MSMAVAAAVSGIGDIATRGESRRLIVRRSGGGIYSRRRNTFLTPQGRRGNCHSHEIVWLYEVLVSGWAPAGRSGWRRGSMIAGTPSLDLRTCSLCRKAKPTREFYQSAEASRTSRCRACSKAYARAHYRSAKGKMALATRETRRGLGGVALKDPDVIFILRLHGGRCWISGAKGQPLVLALAQAEFDVEKPWTCLVPVLRTFATHCGFRLDAVQQRRFAAWCAGGALSSLPAAASCSGPPPPPRARILTREEARYLPPALAAAALRCGC